MPNKGSARSFLRTPNLPNQVSARPFLQSPNLRNQCRPVLLRTCLQGFGVWRKEGAFLRTQYLPNQGSSRSFLRTQNLRNQGLALSFNQGLALSFLRTPSLPEFGVCRNEGVFSELRTIVIRGPFSELGTRRTRVNSVKL